MARRNPIGARKRFSVLRRDDFRCRYCGVTSQDSHLEVDHLRSVAEGGDNSLDNLVTACRECNRSKRHHSTPDPRWVNHIRDADYQFLVALLEDKLDGVFGPPHDRWAVYFCFCAHYLALSINEGHLEPPTQYQSDPSEWLAVRAIDLVKVDLATGASLGTREIQALRQSLYATERA